MHIFRFEVKKIIDKFQIELIFDTNLWLHLFKVNTYSFVVKIESPYVIRPFILLVGMIY